MSNATRTLGGLASSVFDSAVRESGLTNTAIGQFLDCAESRIRKFRSDDLADADVTPSLRHLLALPWGVYRPLVAALHSARIGIHGDPAARPLEALAGDYAVAGARLLGAIGASLGRGPISSMDAANLERELRLVHESGDLLLAGLQARMRGHK